MPPMDLTTAGLEPSPEAMRELIERAADRVIEHLSTLDEQRASDTEGGADVARLAMEPLPEHGVPYHEVLDRVFVQLMSKGYNTASGGALSYVTGGGLLHSAVADLISAATNRYVAYWGACPGLAQLEHQVVRWFADMIGYPKEAGGVLLSGGSTANLSALVAARRTLLPENFLNGTLYASDQVHHSVRKAMVLAGFPDQALRIIPADEQFRMRLDVLAERVAEDRANGRQPFFVVGTAGTTNTGSVDALPALGELARREGLWLHVDAAYGGFFVLTSRGRQQLEGIEQADSVVVDPHKSLFLPFGTGCLLTRDVETLRKSHAVHSDYIHAAVELGEEASALNPADLSPEMSRGARALRVWLPMKLLGARAFREALDEKLDLGAFAAERVRQLDGFELIAAPQLSILAFRAIEPGLDSEALDALNLHVLNGVNREGKVHLSGTWLNGRFALRICVLSFRTHRETIERCMAELKRARGQAAAQPSRGVRSEDAD
jgi:aromatic-L-amino-acid decarboxylase